MSASAVFNLFRCQIVESFRQTLASRISWVMLTALIACSLFCLSVGVSGPKSLRGSDGEAEFIPQNDPQNDPGKLARSGVSVIQGDLTLGFGAVRVPFARDAYDAILGVQLILTSGVVGTLGLLLALVWTAGFVPTFLEPNAAPVLMVKPTPRWLLLLGKFLGVNLFVGIYTAVFLTVVWFLLGVRTGVWTHGLLLSIPLVVLQFSFFYSVSILLAVVSRSTVVCMAGTVLFWLACSLINAERVEALAAGNSASVVVESAYWVLPKPVDLGKMSSDLLNADRYFAQWKALTSYHPAEASILSSMLFSAAVLAASAWRVSRLQY